MSAKRILVGLGVEACSETATRYALEIAERQGAELTGVALFDAAGLSHVGPAPIGAGGFAAQLGEERTTAADQRVKRLEKRFRKACVERRATFSFRREEGDPVASLIAVARYHDLAIVGRDGLCEHGVIDEPPDGLVRLVGAGVRPMIVAPPDYRPIKHVMVAYSGSMESAKTLRRYIQLAPWPAARMTIVHFATDLAAGEVLLTDAQAYCGVHGVEAETLLREGSARQAVLATAEEIGADLIVMGNSARQLLVRRLFGETMLEVVRQSELPLFLCQ